MFIDRYESLMTVKNLKERFIAGVDLTFDDGSPFPDSLFEYCISSAISTLEHELDIYIAPVQKADDVDFRTPNFYNWDFVQLDHYPIVSVDKWEVIFPSNQTLFEYPLSWIRLDADKGVVRLFPDRGQIPQWMVNASFYPYLVMGQSNLPHFYKIHYTAGFDVEKIPFAINEVIGIMASMLPLDIAGDLIAGAGIASSSVGLDGISQSISTTASATNAGYGARIISLKSRLKEHMTTLRNYYKGIIYDSI